MPKLTQNRMQRRALRPANLALLAGLFIAISMLSACGSGSSSNLQGTASLSGNWQFTMAQPADGSFLGGLQGGFVLQDGSSAAGAASFAVFLPQLAIPCSTGSAAITGAMDSHGVWTLTAMAGTQIFTLTGTPGFDGTTNNGSTFVGETMVGTYDSTAGTSPDGAPCGTAQTGLQWSAVLVPPVTGTIQGSFHSTDAGAGLNNQDFPLSGSLTQAGNPGTSSAVVTGTLNFTSPATNASDYLCFDTAPVYGEISGSSVTLQMVGANQSILGLIGEPVGSDGATGLNPVTFVPAKDGYILNGVGPNYLVATNMCPGSIGSTTTAGDYGNLCLAVGSPLGSANACQEPITLFPATLTFPGQTVGTITTQAVSLENNSSGALNGLVLTLTNVPVNATNFLETDTCGFDGMSSLGQPFDLASGQACAITVTFVAQIASQASATLTVVSPTSADNDTVFTVPITGTGVSGGADGGHDAEIE